MNKLLRKSTVGTESSRKKPESLKRKYRYIQVIIVNRSHPTSSQSASKITLDKSILAPDQREFLEKAINLQEYVDGYDEFSKKAYSYVLRKKEAIKKQEFCSQLLDDAILNRTKQIGLAHENNRI
jgi:hypothetical protein